MWPDSLGLRVAYVVSIVVILLFIIAFLGVFFFYSKSQKRVINEALDDHRMYYELKKDYFKFKEKQEKKNKDSSLLSFKDSRDEKRKQQRKTSIIMNMFLNVLYVAALVVVFVSVYYRTQGNTIWFGNDAYLVIETSSMTYANEKNTYLDEYDLLDDSNRIPQYSFVKISRDQSKIDAAVPYKTILAFTYHNEQTREDMIVIHRLINMQYNDDGDLVYTTRGDSNEASLAQETYMLRSQLIGVYDGVCLPILGLFIVYFQSSIGIICIIMAIILLILYSIFYDKILQNEEKRYEMVLEAIINRKPKVLVPKVRRGYKIIFLKPKKETE